MPRDNPRPAAAPEQGSRKPLATMKYQEGSKSTCGYPERGSRKQDAL